MREERSQLSRFLDPEDKILISIDLAYFNGTSESLSPAEAYRSIYGG